MTSAYTSVFKSSHPSVTIVGAGAVGGVLAKRLHEHGYPIDAVLSRKEESAILVAQEVEAPVASSHLRDLPDDTRLVVIAVPDDTIGMLAEHLAYLAHPWKDTLVLHTSGALSSSILSPLGTRGAQLLGFHPLQTVTRSSGPEALDNTYAGIEGQPAAVAAGIEIAVNIGMRYVVLSPESKMRYHLAASMASNFLVTLTAAAQQILTSLDIDRATAQRLLHPLMQTTLDNLAENPPEDVLTGPIVRGDLDTLTGHGLALRRYLPHLVPLYSALATETVPIAVRSSRLSPEQADDVLELIARMVTIPLPATTE